jgi:hypothetical protein
MVIGSGADSYPQPLEESSDNEGDDDESDSSETVSASLLMHTHVT